MPVQALSLGKPQARPNPYFSQLRCQNGTGCIGMEHLCDGIRHCPDSSDEAFSYPNHGTYKVLNNSQARPGQSFDAVILTVHCKLGYGIVNKYRPNSNSTEIYCVNGIWYQNMPQCVRFCKLDPEPSVLYMCHVPGIGLNVCGNYVPPGTLVSPMCNSPSYYSSESLQKMKCAIGFWNYVAKCKAGTVEITYHRLQWDVRS
ncbi:unnamed protein product [Arctia plantaginis]|uniref:Uncharacterized protein n=1 Tax=Arctia plantaginis TaxID=874455 RepID=A0A8S1BSD5_ARCPL|nr:unnamed protein product [Arctia plantaginis]